MSSVKQNVAYSMIGVVLNMIIPLITFPYVSRVLGVEGIGKYNFYSSGQSYLALFAAFGVSIYGVREIGKLRDNKRARAQVLLDLCIVSLIASLICYVAIAFLLLFIDYSNDAIIILLFSLTLLTGAIGPDWYFVGIEKQGFMVLRNLIIKVVSLILIFVFVTEPNHLIRYVGITVFSISAVSVVNFIYLIKDSAYEGAKLPSISKYIAPLFAIFIVDILLRYLGLGDVLLLGVLSNDEAVGIYTMGLKIFAIATSVLKVTATTLMPRASYYLENNDKSVFWDFISKSTAALFLVGVISTVVLFAYATPIVNLMGGSQFADSSNVLRFLSLLFVLTIGSNTFVFQVLYPLGKTRSIIIAHIVGVVLNLFLNFILVPRISYWGTLIAFTGSNTSIFFVLALLEKEALKETIRFSLIKKYLLAGVISLVVAMGLQIFDIYWFLPMILCTAVYFGMLIVFKESILMNYLNGIKAKFIK